MRLYQLLLALTLGAGVSYFAGSAVPEYASGTGGHLLTFLAGSALFSGLFIAYNQSGRNGDCGCPSSRPRNPPSPLVPPKSEDKPVKKDNLTAGSCNTGKCGKPNGNCNKPDGKCHKKPDTKDGTAQPSKPEQTEKPAKDDKQPIGVRQFGSKFRNDGEGGNFIEVETEPQEDGSLKVIVTTSGYTSRHFKERLRPRLEKVGGIKWSNPVNLGENRRQMEGTIASDANAASVLSALEKIK